MHFCEMRATPHLTNEYEIESKNINKTEESSEIKRHRNKNKNNNQNVAPASLQQQLKIRSSSARAEQHKMRHAAPLSGTVGTLQLQLPLLLLLCAGLNGLTHVAALKGKLQYPPLHPSPLYLIFPV